MPLSTAARVEARWLFGKDHRGRDMATTEAVAYRFELSPQSPSRENAYSLLLPLPLRAYPEPQ